MSPALEGGFLTIGPPGRSTKYIKTGLPWSYQSLGKALKFMLNKENLWSGIYERFFLCVWVEGELCLQKVSLTCGSGINYFKLRT